MTTPVSISHSTYGPSVAFGVWQPLRRKRGDRKSATDPKALAKRVLAFGPGALSLNLASMKYVSRQDGKRQEPLPEARLFILKRDDARELLARAAQNWSQFLAIVQNPAVPTEKPQKPSRPVQGTLFDLEPLPAPPTAIELQKQQQSREKLVELRRQGEQLLNPSYHIPLWMLPRGKRTAIEVESAVAPYGNWHKGAQKTYRSLLHQVLPLQANRPVELTGRDVDIVATRLDDMNAIADACKSDRISTPALLKGIQATIYFPSLQAFSPINPEPMTEPRASEAIERIYSLGRKPR